jgi:D-psicose/D-tagatose/L-ribulose 3-epimerase
MRIAISNIAWHPSEEEPAAALLAAHGIQGLEVAPTKVWAKPTEVDSGQIDAFQYSWMRRGISLVGMQALLFGKPELQLFGEEECRRATIEYLTGIIRLAGRLGTTALVFGSPKNRMRGAMSATTATDIAIEFFNELGDVAGDNGVQLCIEPNPSAYGCDFVQTGAEGLELVQRIDHRAVRLHLDAGILTMNQEDIDHVLEDSIPYLAHFHISEPQLGVIGSGGVDHARIAGRLRKLGYRNWVSIEMRDGWTSPNTLAISEALDYVTHTYR